MYTLEEQNVLKEAFRIMDKAAGSGPVLTDPTMAGRYFASYLSDARREEFVVAFLNTKHRLITTETLFQGTIDWAEVHPREVVRRALEVEAAAVMFAHNHPSGDPDPSASDRTLTKRLKEACGLFSIRVLDHIVVGAGKTYSFAEQGIL